MISSLKPGWWPLVKDLAAREFLQNLRVSNEARLTESRWSREILGIERAHDLRASMFDASGAIIRLGSSQDLGPEDQLRLDAALAAFRPWKKGPFSIMGRDVDAEWRSDWKWDRLAPYVQSLEGQIVADIGCNNGYYMYRMLAAGAKQVVGLEPMVRNALNFKLLQNLWPTPAIDFELFGVEVIDRFGPIFDSIFCLGILYHHTDPVSLLRKMRQALRPKGRIFIDCQGIIGQQPIALTPASRYAGATGIWFLPTPSCLENWIHRAGFTRISWIYSGALSCEEQRATPWAPIKSLADFLNPADLNLTTEGYPAPQRYYLLVQA